MELTQIIIAAITLLGTVIAAVVAHYVVPWLKNKNLYEAALIAVHAAEALYGRYNGNQKLTAALQMLKEKGYKVESTEVVNAVQAAWKQLDIAMYNDGEKLAE